MPEIGMSVSMSGDGKRSVGHRPQATAPILDSTTTSLTAEQQYTCFWGNSRHRTAYGAVPVCPPRPRSALHPGPSSIKCLAPFRAPYCGTAVKRPAHPSLLLGPRIWQHFCCRRCGEDRRDGFGKIDRHADISSVPAGWTSFLFCFRLWSRPPAGGGGGRGP